jgi:hypothetical protein
MVPVSLLPEMDRLFRSDILPHSVGIVPLSLFPDRPKVVKLADIFPNSVGKVPAKSLCDNSMNANIELFANPEGIDPDR